MNIEDIIFKVLRATAYILYIKQSFLIRMTTSIGNQSNLQKSSTELSEKLASKINLAQRFWTQGPLHLRHMDGLSTALLATASFFRDPFGGRCVDDGLKITRLANWYGWFTTSKFCSTAVRRESNRFRE